jgi:Lrp/AsnC family transcriptional regulator for asnA, asnC and gidA
MKELQEIDVTILQELLKDGRKSFTTIAKENHTSTDVIWKHYKEMKKAGIIVGATIQFNYQKFGYSGVAMIQLNVESQYIDEVFERLNKIPDISTFRHFNATHPLAAISMLKNLRDLEHAKEIINKQGKINEIKTYLWIDVRNTPENILSEKCNRKTGRSEEKVSQLSTMADLPNDSVKIDEIDMQIVNALTKNGRTPFSKIGQEIGASTDTVSRRYEKLRKNNFIKVSIQFNPLELGYQSVLDIDLALVDQSETEEIVEKIAKIPGVAYLIKISGTYDLSVAALVKDCNDIIKINEEIVKIPNIKRMEATLRALRPRWPGPRQYISTF